jgi:hypothetical protein
MRLLHLKHLFLSSSEDGTRTEENQWMKCEGDEKVYEGGSLITFGLYPYVFSARVSTSTPILDYSQKMRSLRCFGCRIRSANSFLTLDILASRVGP